ncbi:hypothetical protein Leryth_017336 [Lithospermum erythrorhizon]|nr:hypothetical protein Leryth_017336 [Lithospermum erythrorhizon]
MASLPLACLITPSSNLKQSHKIDSNPTSTLFNFLSSTRTNKPVHLKGFIVCPNAKDGSVGVATVHRKKQGSKAYKEVAKEIKDARKTRDQQWKMALETLLFQIKNIRRKIETHFMDKPDVANPMLVILKDVESLVEIHKVNIGLKNPIPTTDAIMTVANHFQAYKHSEGIVGAQVYLNFAPVREETPPTEIQVVEGELPSCIKGMMIRNGPNPQFEPLAKYQWMDGDGMLHATYFQDGKVTYASRYTKTSRFKQEQITGQAEFPKYGDYTGAFGVFTAFTQLLKSVFVLDTSYGCGVANESIAYHAGMVMVLEDFDRPYAIKIKEDGDLETLGVYDFKNKLSHNCTPHTKKDPKTANSWEDGDDKVVLYGCKMSPEKAENDSIPIIKSVLLCRALVGENVALSFPELYKFTFNLKTGKATQEMVSENKVDFPKINENYMAG